MKIYIFTIIILLSLLTVNCSGNNDNKTVPIVINGTIALRSWDFDKKGILDLNGEWEFYWEKFLKLENIRNHKAQFIKVPGTWFNQRIKNKKLPKKGYATYKLNLISPINQKLHLYFDPPSSSNKVYFNNELLKSDGKPDISDETELKGERIETIQLDFKTNENNLIIHISNYIEFGSGLEKTLFIGNRKDVNSIFMIRVARDVFLFCTLFLIFIYNLIHFNFRIKNTQNYKNYAD